MSRKRPNKPNTNAVDPVKEVPEIPAGKRRKTVERKRSESDNEDESTIVVSNESMNRPEITIPRPEGAPFPDAISPDVLQFLSELKVNNDRDFMRLNQASQRNPRPARICNNNAVFIQ